MEKQIYGYEMIDPGSNDGRQTPGLIVGQTDLVGNNELAVCWQSIWEAQNFEELRVGAR